MSLEELQPSLPLPGLAAAPRTRQESQRVQRRASWQRFTRHPLGLLGLGLIGLFSLMAVSHPILMATAWERQIYHPLVGFDLESAPHPGPISSTHFLGTDSLGRDVFSQLLYAAGPSFGLGLLAGGMAMVLATLVGVASAYFGGVVDDVLMSVTDAFVLMPPQVVLLVVGLLLNLQWPSLGLLYGLFAGLGAMAVIVRSHALSLVVRPYVEASRVSGGSHWHILRVHVLPDLVPLMLLNVMFTVTGSVLTEALLSFFGRTRIRMSWGSMIWFGQVTFRLARWEGQWHAIVPPALAIILFCAGFYMVGRALDDVFNPRLRKR